MNVTVTFVAIDSMFSDHDCHFCLYVSNVSANDVDRACISFVASWSFTIACADDRPVVSRAIKRMFKSCSRCSASMGISGSACLSRSLLVRLSSRSRRVVPPVKGDVDREATGVPSGFQSEVSLTRRSATIRAAEACWRPVGPGGAPAPAAGAGIENGQFAMLEIDQISKREIVSI